MLTAAEARALITTSLSDQDLEDVIAREEAWLARRIGPLEGQRTETFVADSGAEVLWLARPTTTIVVEDDSGDRDNVRLMPWADVHLLSGAWSGSITVRYTPDDDAEVRRALITLVRLTVAESAYTGESAGGYSHSIDPAAQRAQRWSAWRGLLRPPAPRSMRIRGPEGVGMIRSVSVLADLS